jgi:hypothetical protein
MSISIKLSFFGTKYVGHTSAEGSFIAQTALWLNYYLNPDKTIKHLHIGKAMRSGKSCISAMLFPKLKLS